MSNYGRVPNVSLEVMPNIKQEIFVKNPQTEEKKTTQKKEFNLKKHLAECRKKSLAVRKAKAEERKRNKKPRGRPKKVKEVVEEIKPTPQKTIETPIKTEIVKENVVEEKKEEPTVSKDLGVNNNQATLDYDKIVDLLYNKLKPEITNVEDELKPVIETETETEIEPIKRPTLKRQVTIDETANTYNSFTPNNYFDMRSFENKIREDERKRLKKESQVRQQKDLRTATASYFNKLPANNYLKPDTFWDSCFNPPSRRF